MTGTFHKMQGLADLPAILYRHGIQKVVICPGSRDAPIINTFISSHQFDCISIVDERSAAYFALGLAQQSNKAVAITCTSGTAAVNLFPAITEAYYLGVPLVVITADRPPEWIDKGDGQTIRQTGLFKNHIKHEVNLPVETVMDTDLRLYHQLVNECLMKATSPKQGPVHLNVPLREPLYEELPEPNSLVGNVAPEKKKRSISARAFTNLQRDWNKYAKKLIIAGAMARNNLLQEVLNKLSQRDDAVVLAENIANIHGRKVINNPEALFASINGVEHGNFRPDLLITLGGAVVSKRMKQYLRKYKAGRHIQIGEETEFIDTYQTPGGLITADPVSLLDDLAKTESQSTGFASIWLQQNKRVEDKTSSYIKNAPFSDLTVTQRVLEMLPSNVVMHLANSTPVRLSQLFHNRVDTVYYSNRGTSGIDGCVSTAVGAAYASNKLHFLLCGDLSFIYDSNALWNNSLPTNLKIIVLNNKGGNIFNLIKTGKAFDKVRPYLITPHNVSIEKLSKAFGVDYYYADDPETLKSGLSNIFASKYATVLEVSTNMEINTDVFRGFFNF